MSGEPISMQEWLQHATPNHPLHLIRQEARALVEEATSFATNVESWLPHFEPDDPIVYAGDEDEWGYLYTDEEALD